MVAAACSEDEFIRLFKEHGPAKTASILGIGISRVFERRRNWESRNGRPLVGPPHRTNTRVEVDYPSRATLNVKDGVIIVGSDGHYWPGPASPAHKAFVHFCKMVEPSAVILNGDVMDLPGVSRHPPIGWEAMPTVAQEIEAAQERLHEIEMATPKGIRMLWPLGNHDSRFETRLATLAPQFAKVNGVHLRDHFSNRWEPCWSAWVNDEVVIKHRFKGGIHATHTNTLWAGKTMVTGHLHSLKVTPFTDYNGIRFGIDTGCLADTDGKQFLDYTEDNPKNWRSGFVVLTFRGGELMWPEVVNIRNGRVEFRGDFVEVDHHDQVPARKKKPISKKAKRTGRRR